MAVVVTFFDYTPPPREDGIPWTQVQVMEGITSDGPWTNIDIITLDPVDVDPTEPLTRDFTTENGTLVSGWYQINFVDNEGHLVPTDPVHNTILAPHPFQPTLPQIGQVIMSRTKNRFGKLTGTFTSETTPDTVQAGQIARNAAQDIATQVGDTVPPALVDDAQRVTAIRAAMLIELGFFSDQVNSGRSIYPQLKLDYEEALMRLQTAIVMIEEGETNVTSQAPSRVPSYHFPQHERGWLNRRM